MSGVEIITDGPLWLLCASTVLMLFTEIVKRGIFERFNEVFRSDWWPRASTVLVAVLVALAAPGAFPEESYVGRLLLAVAVAVTSWGEWEMLERRELVDGSRTRKLKGLRR